MVTFGLITEGITDQIIIENVLCGFFDSEDIDVNMLQPLRDETDKNRCKNYGGWKLTFDYCASTVFRDAMPFNDYIIIQIDTDVSDEVHYDISKLDENGDELSPEQLIENVKQKFIDLISNNLGEEFYKQCADKLIFAISVHSIECWLLPLYENEKKKKVKIKNCLENLNRALKQKELSSINLNNKSPDDYETISKLYRKHKILMRHYKDNPSFKIFIDEVQEHSICIDDEDD